MTKKRWGALQDILSSSLKSDVNRIKIWEDRHNSLFGKLLVFVGYYIFMRKDLSFNRYKQDKNGKPYLNDSSVNFNISHSGKTVVCAMFPANIKIGADIEVMKKININDLKDFFHPNENSIIYKNNSIEEFYKYWTRKEALVKAIGKGLLLPIQNLDTTQKIINQYNENYFLKSYKFNDHFCSLSYNTYLNKIDWIEVKF
ncbi:MAG: 4'-phosphopantetheinyl transferase superfamily protein [Bacteroidota bacterium]